MKKILTCLVAVLITISAMAAHHGSAEDEVRAAAEAFSTAYASNDIDGYFSYYAEDVTMFYYGARQDLSAYHKEWSAEIAAGGGIEVNEMSDVVIQMMPGNEVAIVTSFIDNRSRSPEGEVSTVRAFETDVWQKIDGEWKIVTLHYTEIEPED